MIPRYSRPDMVNIWSEQFKLSTMLRVEIEICKAQCKLGLIPQDSCDFIEQNAKFDAQQILEIEKKSKHDVVAFIENVSSNLGEHGRYLHLGVTSYDIIDTVFAVQLSSSIDILEEDLKKLLIALKTRAYETKYLNCVGRSHGIHAEPMTFGMKFARFYAEFERNLYRLQTARNEISVCAISGPVGTFSSIPNFVQEYVAEALDLRPEKISTQVIPRDRHASFFSTLAIIAASIENIATEVRNLQRTEVSEAYEFFSKGQKGSSAMPHKRNPVLTENLTGLSRIIRSCVVPALENVTLWHERDISHSSVERVIAPDACITADFALSRITGVIENLVINSENLNKNLNLTKGLIFSHKVLVALIRAGLTRVEAYNIVQRNSFLVLEKDINFIDALKQDSDTNIISKELDDIFDPKDQDYRGNIDFIFDQVFT